jgi:hypothetical protein
MVVLPPKSTLGLGACGLGCFSGPVGLEGIFPLPEGLRVIASPLPGANKTGQDDNIGVS